MSIWIAVRPVSYPLYKNQIQEYSTSESDAVLTSGEDTEDTERGSTGMLTIATITPMRCRNSQLAGSLVNLRRLVRGTIVVPSLEHI